MKNKVIWILAAELVLIAAGGVPSLRAQTAPGQRLVHASMLEQEHRSADAIAELRALLDSHSLNAQDEGRAWKIQGAAFMQTGDRDSARQAYERSIRLLAKSPGEAGEYAAALDDLGGVYAATGQLERAARSKAKALHVYEEMDDHAGMARSSSDLAGIAFDRGRMGDGRRYLQRAAEEAQRASDLGDDDRASIASMQGTLAQHDGDFGAAAARYREAFALWKGRHGEEHPYTGWGYMLLGEAHAKSGELQTARAEMEHGMAILGRTLDHGDARYLTAELAYAQVLRRTGDRAEAERLQSSAQQQLTWFYGGRCADCTISVAAFR